MEPDWSKLDMGLEHIYFNYLRIKDKINLKGVWIHPALKNRNRDIYLTLQYQGDLKDIEESGFSTQSVEREGVANGIINVDILPNLSNHPSVIKLSYGDKFYPVLDTSAFEILARGYSPPGGFAPRVWSVDIDKGDFSGKTGEGVIIGIIDTGIEWRHENFMRENSAIQTRILRIWDQGLEPETGEKKPDVSLLTGGPSYGVEYTQSSIMQELDNPSKPSKIRHKDCVGHGTHVAGIAAGNGNEYNHPLQTLGFQYVGIAPKAELIIVKYLALEKEPPNANPLKRFKDAISYILKVADRGGAPPGLPKLPSVPVVINCSFGGSLDPHDGLGVEQKFLELTFKTAREKICVFAAGNDSGKRHHAKITIPSGGSVEIPFELYDPRTNRKTFKRCKAEEDIRPINLCFWYRYDFAGLISVQFKPPQPDTTFSAYNNTPVALGSSFSANFDVNRVVEISHSRRKDDRPGPPIAIEVERIRIRITVTPHSNLHKKGTYWVKINGPANSEIHVWCDRGNGYGFKLADSITTTTPIEVTDYNTIGRPGDAKSVITVAAYDHHEEDGNNDGVYDDNRRMACFSSKGPLLDYSPGYGVLVDKPDISAPGWRIVSTKSYRTQGSDTYSSVIRSNYVRYNGTSMAAPHITGVVALMLQKKKNQTVTDIKRELSNAARGSPNIFRHLKACDTTVTGVLPVATSNEAGSGKVDAKKTLDNITP